MVDGKSKEEFLPYDVVINILKRLPVKSLIRFKCVSKDWLNLLETTPYFTQQHLRHSAHNNAFLLLQRIPRQPRPLPFSSCLIGPDINVVCNPRFADIASPAAKIVASCNGLLCLRDKTALSLVNPATRQTKQVPGTTLFGFHYVGFGFSPAVNDYKIVRISMSVFDEEDQIVVLDDVRVDRAEVYSLTTGSWREIDATNLRPLCLVSSSVATTGTIFWLATMTSDSDTDSEFVVSFDIGRELFTLLNGPPLPPSPTRSYSNVLVVYNDKLAMFRHYIIGNFESCSFDLWVLEDVRNHTCGGPGESWVKMYSVGPFSRILYPLSIWRDEIVCREELSRDGNEYRGVETVLSLFNPLSNELKKLPGNRDEYCYVPFTYAESLVPVGNIHHEH
ncbi:putative F-box protein [Spatholobus suberectus]|nr:putative F-box protein [Spatholobus suberectus]